MITDAVPANNPNAGPEPVQAEPNHVREKTYKDPTTPKKAQEALEGLPESTAQDKIREEMSAATDRIKRRI